MSHTPRHSEELHCLQRKKREGQIPAKAMSCKINMSDQCFINKKMSYFTFLCGPLSPRCMMECQITLEASTFRHVIECTDYEGCVCLCTCMRVCVHVWCRIGVYMKEWDLPRRWWPTTGQLWEGAAPVPPHSANLLSCVVLIIRFHAD